jgi:mRNA interferase MazF
VSSPQPIEMDLETLMIRRGDIYFINLDPTSGREQNGRRPVLVVSVDAINSQPLVVTVVVGTAARNVPRDYPVNVRYEADVTGLPEDTVFLCFQIRSLDPARFLDQDGVARPAGVVPMAQMEAVDQALRRVLGI